MYPVYLLLGPEKGLKDDFIKKLKETLGACEVSRFYASEDYESQFYGQISNLDLFAAHKIVILDQAEQIKTKEKTKPLVSYIQNPSETVTLIIISDDLYINSDVMGAVPDQKNQILKFYELFENKKSEWLVSFFKRSNMSIDGDACSAIIEKVENNIQEFQNVCGQIAVYMELNGKNRITESDVDDFLTHTRQETEFTLFGYMARGKLESSLECLDALLHTNDASSLAAVICSRLGLYFRRAYSVQMNISKGISVDEALKLKYFDSDRPVTMLKDRETYKEAVRRYSLKDIQRILVLLAEYDIKIKETGTALQQTVLEKCILDIVCSKGRHNRKASFAEI